jgi:hypothetical protein
MTLSCPEYLGIVHEHLIKEEQRAERLY